MNIFYLHHLPSIAASYHCDKHVGKMLIESCQLMATAHHYYGEGDQVTYRATHSNHPSAIWVRASRLHYNWLSDLALYLDKQFMKRYAHRHKSGDVLRAELINPPAAMWALPSTWQPPTLAMPDEFKSDDHIQSYRRYYASKAATMPLMYSKGRDTQPAWLSELLAEELV